MSEQQTARRFFSAATLERAIMEAAGHYGVPPAELAYKAVKKRHLSRKIVIRVDPENPQTVAPSTDATTTASDAAPSTADAVSASEAREELALAAKSADEPEQELAAEPRVEAPAAKRTVAPSSARKDIPRPPRRSSSPVDPSTLGEMKSLPSSFEHLRQSGRRAAPKATAVAREQLSLLLDLASLDLEAEVFEGEEGYQIEVSGSDADLVIEDEGQVMRAIEHLLPRLMQGDLDEVVPCQVDCNGFQVLREEALRSKAQRAAAAVRRRAQSETLEPMHPADRRIVHVTLVADDSVTTESVGRGYFRRVSIRPA